MFWFYWMDLILVNPSAITECLKRDKEIDFATSCVDGWMSQLQCYGSHENPYCAWWHHEGSICEMERSHGDTGSWHCGVILLRLSWSPAWTVLIPFQDSVPRAFPIGSPLNPSSALISPYCGPNFQHVNLWVHTLVISTHIYISTHKWYTFGQITAAAWWEINENGFTYSIPNHSLF